MFINPSTKTLIESTLKADPRLWNDAQDDLNQTFLIDLVQQYDPTILGLLIDNTDLKAKFFVQVNAAWVFKQSDFRFFMEENKVDNSYTAYKNKIGLTDGRKFLRDTPDVVLDFPFKDCVLEGGQSKDDTRRNEIFFNKVIAHDEIDRLLSPKAFTGYKRFTTDKVIDKGLDFDIDVTATPTLPKNKTTEDKYFNRNKDGTITDNLIIKGNNLIALHTLKSEFKAKVKLIYIDPPYNTGSDSFGYNDRFNHSTWLVFMKNRLEVARELLRDDGVIFVQCDDNEQAYLKVLMDEIFGRENFVSNIVWQKKYTQSNDAKYFSATHDFIICFGKNPKKTKIGLLGRTELQNSRYTNPDNDPRGGWKATPLHAKSGSNPKEIVFQNGIKWTPPAGTFNRYSVDTIKKAELDGRISFSSNIPSMKSFLSEMKEGVIPKTIWLYDEVGSNDSAKSEVKNIFSDNPFSTPKPETLMKRIIELSTNPNDIVLDYHLGSGTTAAVAHKMGRQYIGVEQMDYIQDISCVRMQKVLDGEQGGISKSVNWQGGGEFVYLELAQNNETATAEILACTNTKKLVALFDRLYNRYFLSYNLKIKDFAEKTMVDADFLALDLDSQKQVFLEMLDLNQMYVHATEVEDKMFGVSKQDVQVTNEFYGYVDEDEINGGLV